MHGRNFVQPWVGWAGPGEEIKVCAPDRLGLVSKPYYNKDASLNVRRKKRGVSSNKIRFYAPTQITITTGIILMRVGGKHDTDGEMNP